MAAVKDRGHDVFDRHLLQQRAEWRRLLDTLLDPLDGIRAGVWKRLDEDSSRRGDSPAPVQHAEENSG